MIASEMPAAPHVEGGRARTRAPVAERWPDWLVVLAFFVASRAVIHALGVIGAVCFVDDDTFTDKGIESLDPASRGSSGMRCGTNELPASDIPATWPMPS